MIVMTIGTWDIPHLGHYLFLERASQLGDKLIVGINSDEYTTRYKGKPLFDQYERQDLIENLGVVDETFFNDDDRIIDWIKLHRPDYLAIGSDWIDRYLSQIKMSEEELRNLGCALVYLPYTKTISTTMIKERCERDFYPTINQGDEYPRPERQTPANNWRDSRDWRELGDPGNRPGGAGDSSWENS